MTLNGKQNDGPREDFPLPDGDPIDGSPIHPIQLDLPEPKRKFKRDRNYAAGIVKRAGPKIKGAPDG